MKNFGRKFALIGALTLLGLVAIWPPSEKLKLGIDLSGGTILVYQAKETNKEGFRMEDLIAALKRRVNPEGVLDIPIRQVGADRVEIILPKASADQVERVKRQMTAVGAMEFRILADSRDLEDAQAIERATSAPLNKPPSRYGWARLGETVESTRPTDAKATWTVRLEGNRLIDESQEWVRDRYVGSRVTLTPVGAVEGAGSLTFPVVSNDATSLRLDPARAITFMGNREKVRRVSSVEAEMPNLGGYAVRLNPSRILADPYLAIRSEPQGNGITEYHVLYEKEPARRIVTGEFLSKVYPTEDEQVQPAVGFAFNAEGARRFGALTGSHTPREDNNFMYHLAIVLDDLVMSAPVIRQEIRESGIIEGMQPQQVEDLINILRAGSLPASIDPIPLQQEQIGPTLGKDTIEKGVRAIAISMMVVPIFMILYYRFAGVVAVVALILNMLLLLGSMALVNASFTLPGLAGLALTIGMAVDANVLIFERMREEAERGANLGAQIRNGFGRAWSTILDSNVTTILSGLVLWFIGTEEIKGFATTLIIGLVWNLFTAVYVSHVIFDYWYSKGWIKRLSFMKIMGKTNINFTGPRRMLQVISMVVIVIGMGWFASRRGNNFNIDFTGGTLVTIQLDPKNEKVASLSESQRASLVREQASEAGLRDVSVESLNVAGEAAGTRFNIRTTEADAAKVQQSVQETFGAELARLRMTVSSPKPIPEAPKPAAGERAAAADRFAGGLTYRLEFNRDVAIDPVQVNLENILRKLDVGSPEGKFELQRPAPTSDGRPTLEVLVLKTSLDEATSKSALDQLAQVLPNDPNLLFERLENFGAAVASDTQTMAVLAIVASWAVMIAYLWLRFKSATYGLAAVVALMHDVLVTLGAVAISPYKIDLPMVAAFLTLIGFSVNDTIVIFDRIRELKGKSPYLTEELVNSAINQTLSRTILTSLTAWMVVVILYLFGGEGLQGFSFCLVVGFLTGTYSTIYIAAPILIDWSGKPPAKKVTAKDAEFVR